MKQLYKFFNDVKQCPMCGHNDYVVENKDTKNRYSDQIAELLEITEDELIDSVKNLRCKNCNVGYKDKWFKEDIYYKVFIEASPFHPQGWDSISNLFDEKNFIKNVDLLKDAVLNNDIYNMNKHRRTVLSYINNITLEYIDKNDLEKFIDKSLNLDYMSLSQEDYLFLVNEVSKHMITPREFGRFTGYRSPTIDNFFKKNITSFDTYAEIGSPLWGMFPTYSKENKELIFFKDEDKTFWGERDEKDGIRSWDYAKEKFGVELTTLSEYTNANRKKIDLMYMVHYLDHNGNPYDLLKRVSKVTKYLMLLNHKDKPSFRFIQHFTNFNDKVFETIKDDLNFEIIDTYKEDKNNVLHGILIKFK